MDIQQQDLANPFSDLNFNSDNRQCVLRFGKIPVKGSIHGSTILTIKSTGEWQSVTRIDTSRSAFLPHLKLLAEFYQRGTCHQVPLGTSPADWEPIHVWTQDLSRQKDKVVCSKGKSDFFQRHFQAISSGCDQRLIVRVAAQKTLLEKLFK